MGKSTGESISEESQKELESFESRNPKYDSETRDAIEQKRYTANTRLRVYLAVWASVIVFGWLVCVLVVLMLNDFWYKLSDSVLITLLTTTTINVLGLVIIAMSDLFNGKSEQTTENN